MASLPALMAPHKEGSTWKMLAPRSMDHVLQVRGSWNGAVAPNLHNAGGLGDPCHC